MNSEKRFLFALLLSFLIIAFYPTYLKMVSPKRVQNGPAVAETAALKSPSAETPKPQLVSPEPSKPATPAADERPENLYQFSNHQFLAEFSDKGGTIRKLKLANWTKGKEKEISLIEANGAGGAFTTELYNQGTRFATKIFSLETLDEKDGIVRFSAEEPGRWKITKEYNISNEKPDIEMKVRVENLGSSASNVSLELGTQLTVAGEQAQNKMYAESYVSLKDKLMGTRLDKIEKKPFVLDGAIAWQALARKYFAVIIRPGKQAVYSRSETDGAPAKTFMNTLRMTPEEIAGGGEIEQKFLIYAGPQYYKDLKSYGYGFQEILSTGFFGIFKLWLLVSLDWFYKLVRNYGWAIILVTIAIKIIFTPLTHISFESMKKMQELQPKLKALQERYKKDQATLSKEMMELYKKHKINPMSGCLPMLLQIPIFIAFYNVLGQTVELKGAPFMLWIKDLSEPDRLITLPFSLPFLGDGINVLPLLMIGSMVWQQKLTPQSGSSDQQKMMAFMPIIFGFIFYNLPSGLVLYWFVNNLLSIFHQLFIKGKALPHIEEA